MGLDLILSGNDRAAVLRRASLHEGVKRTGQSHYGRVVKDETWRLPRGRDDAGDSRCAQGCRARAPRIDEGSDQKIERAAGLSPTTAYEKFETALRERLAAVERAAHEAALAALDVDEPRLRIDRVEHVRVGRHATTFMSQAGPVTVMRSLYRRVGERNGPTFDLVALRSGAVEGVWLPGTAQAMAYLLQQGTSREAESTAQEMGRLPYSRSSFERVGHAVGSIYAAGRKHVERDLIEAFVIPDEARSISLSLDRVAVPMEEPRARAVGRRERGMPSGQ